MYGETFYGCHTAQHQLQKSIRGVSGLAVEESKMHTLSTINELFFCEKYLCKI